MNRTRALFLQASALTALLLLPFLLLADVKINPPKKPALPEDKKPDVNNPPKKPALPEDKKPDVIYVPTPQGVVDKMLEMARVKKTDVVYDLGCGDGRIVVTAAKKYGTRSFGFDIDPERIQDSLKNVEKNKVQSLVTIENKDIFTLDLSKADVVTLYLLPTLNVKLIPQLEKLKPGSRIVSHDFNMEGVKPKQAIKFKAKDDHGTEREHEIFLWETPLEKGEK